MLKDFNEDLDFGKIGEDLFEKEILSVLVDSFERITNLQDQKTKGDFKTEKGFYEIKTRKPNYSFDDILIEVGHLGKVDSIGWLDKYSNETSLVYQKTKIINGKVCLDYPVFMFKPFELRKHISWIKRFKIKESLNKGYKTQFICIPINKLSQKINFYSITEDKRIVKWKK